MDDMATGISRAKEFLNRTHELLIGDKWQPALSGATLDSINPCTGDRISSFAAGDEADVDLAVKAAQRAIESPDWAEMKPNARGRLLLRVADLIMENADELAALESLDQGHSRTSFRESDMPAAADVFRYYAGWCTKIYGSTVQLSSPGQSFSYTLKEPAGVVGLIIPWNLPFVLAAWKLAPALAAGCTCILKPAEETSLSALRLGELLLEAGFPPGVVNIVTGLGEKAGAAIAAHDGIAKVSFTGSTEVGRLILDAAKGNLKKVTLELGGKSPNIIMPDANLEGAVPGTAFGVFFNAGQVCAAGSRLYVHNDVAEQVIGGVCGMAQKIPVGPGDDPEAVIGPLISEKQLERVSGYVASGLDDGAQVAIGGERIGDKGYFYQPTVMVNTNSSMRMVREEIFGPVLVTETFDDLDDVIAKANDSIYGLSAKLWTQNLSTAHKVAARLKAGTVSVNGGGFPDPNLPMGGYKQSGWGRELGKEGLEQYLETKSVNITL